MNVSHANVTRKFCQSVHFGTKFGLQHKTVDNVEFVSIVTKVGDYG